MAQRGRPKDTPVEEIVKYTQVVKHNDGAVTTWYWDKSISIDGPIKTVTKWPKGALDFNIYNKIIWQLIPLSNYVELEL